MVTVYVLTKLSFDSKGDVTSRNVGVTFNIHEAEAHRAHVENEFDAFQIDTDWREDAAATDLVVAMREFCSTWCASCSGMRSYGDDGNQQAQFIERLKLQAHSEK
jgi:hypothetical protein